MSELVFRRVLTIGAVASLVVGFGVASFPPTAVAKPARTVESITLNAAAQTLLSTTHKKLQVAVFVNRINEGGSPFASADITVTRHGLPENHTWTFDVTNGSLTYSPSTGKGSLKTGSQLEPFGQLTLRLTAVGKKSTASCKGSATVSQRVKVRGVLSFDTRSTGKGRWGTVGGSTKVTFSGSSYVGYQLGPFQDCNHAAPACVSDVSWTATKEGSSGNELSLSGSFTKVGGKTVKTIEAVRDTRLATPKHAIRVDSVQLSGAKMTFAKKKGIASVHIGASGGVTGSASLVSPTAGSSYSEQCGHHHTQKVTSWVAPYRNGKTPLTVVEQVEGDFRVPNLSGSIDKDSVS
jgi:hypothetical protein